MAEEDIYGNKRKYERFIDRLDDLAVPIEAQTKYLGTRRYYCKNPVNLQYFRALDKHLQTKDNSYIRRLRLMRTFLIITHATEKELSKATRDDINSIVTFNHTVNQSSNSKADFVRDIRYIWKTLFPEKDKQGRIDDTIVPYTVRHLSAKIDKSRQTPC